MSDKPDKTTEKHQIVMIGAGPAALAASVYTTREDLDTVLVEKGVIGGLAAITDMVDNYPGFPEGITGLELAEELRKQAERFGAKIKLGEVKGIRNEGDHRIVETSEGDIQANAVLVATGSDYKKIGVLGEEEYYGKGVHYCATCDGAFYRDKKLAVVGGGNSAAQEAIYLTRFSTHIDVLIRSDKWRASDVLVDEIKKLEESGKITVHFNTTTDGIIGKDGFVVKAKGTDKIRKETVEYNVDGVFIFVGLKPNTGFLEESDVELDERGFVKTDLTLKTTMPGVFCAGDVRSGATMQIASAVGEGATAALKIREFLEGGENIPETNY